MKCKVSKLCGGCSYLHMAQKQQAQVKKQKVEELVEKYHLLVKVQDVIMAEQDTKYRNKIIVGFAKDNGKVYSGLYAAHSHKVVRTQNCLMHPDIVNEVINKITELVDSMKILLYNEKTGTGLLRHVVIRYAATTNEMMVTFVTARKEFPNRKNLINVLRTEFPNITTILQNINPRNTSIVLQDETLLLYGKGMITDELCGIKISFDPSSFYQIHVGQCEKLYNIARNLANLTGNENVLDTYCGVGSIGLTMANSCKQLTGVESNKQAVENAKFNAKQNGIKNARFIGMDSTKFMVEAKKQRANYDVIILDPPRAGTTPEFIDASTSLNPKRIVYISCDPRTMVR
ncbi:MAG: 23S rRNA (uracil(1939)-C(5))-methyltransferase RlmD, partial [Firmicutes bacterium]|nr:23S rRNA (uracil(1939)-C(5))-methyltransferase RlmD [Bacillota bacterium]